MEYTTVESIEQLLSLFNNNDGIKFFIKSEGRYLEQREDELLSFPLGLIVEFIKDERILHY